MRAFRTLSIVATAVAALAIGIYPKLLLDRILPAVEAMRFLK